MRRVGRLDVLRALVLVGALAAFSAAPACAAGAARANDDAPVALTQRLGADLPLDSRWRDADGRSVALGDYFADGKPVLLVLGYYTCPQLCGLLMHGVLEAVQAAGPSARSARIVAVSIDPGDTPATARARLATDLAYASFLRRATQARGPLPELHLLTGDAAAIDRVVADAGYRIRLASDPSSDARVDHPAALVVATPHGRISRYLMGVRFDPLELGDALADARDERTGALSDRIALLCAHLDLALGRHSRAVLDATRGVTVLIVLALAAWCWRRRGGAAPRRTVR
jgi:protein SCO1/2